MLHNKRSLDWHVILIGSVRRQIIITSSTLQQLKLQISFLMRMNFFIFYSSNRTKRRTFNANQCINCRFYSCCILCMIFKIKRHCQNQVKWRYETMSDDLLSSIHITYYLENVGETIYVYCFPISHLEMSPQLHKDHVCSLYYYNYRCLKYRTFTSRYLFLVSYLLCIVATNRFSFLFFVFFLHHF